MGDPLVKFFDVARKFQNIAAGQSQIGNENARIRLNVAPAALAHTFAEGMVAFSFFPADRKGETTAPSGITKLEWDRADFRSAPGTKFLQFVVNLKAERSFARDDNDTAAVAALDQWFERFERLLGDLYADPELRLEFKRETYDFLIAYPEPGTVLPAHFVPGL